MSSVSSVRPMRVSASVRQKSGIGEPWHRVRKKRHHLAMSMISAVKRLWNEYPKHQNNPELLHQEPIKISIPRLQKPTRTPQRKISPRKRNLSYLEKWEISHNDSWLYPHPFFSSDIISPDFSWGIAYRTSSTTHASISHREIYHGEDDMDREKSGKSTIENEGENKLYRWGNTRDEKKTQRVYPPTSRGTLERAKSPEIYEYKNHQIRVTMVKL